MSVALRFQEVELAIIGAYFGRIAFEAVEEYQGVPPLRELRSLMSLWPNVEQWVIRADQVETKTVSDLVGKRVNVGRPGSGALQPAHASRAGH